MSEIKYEIVKKVGVLSVSVSDIVHYGRAATALGESVRLMAEVDAVIESAGGWPIQ